MTLNDLQTQADDRKPQGNAKKTKTLLVLQPFHRLISLLIKAKYILKTKLLFILLLHAGIVNGQGSWTTEADFGGGIRTRSTGFSVGAKGYFATGTDTTIRYKDLWEYDPSLNVWTQMANLPSNGRVGAVSFSIGTKGYVGLGKDTTQLNDFWEYDPSLNTWTSIASFPGVSRSHAVGFSIGNKGYIGTGRDEITDSLFNDFWEYSPVSNAWTSLTNFPGTNRTGASGFAIGGNGYIGGGTDFVASYCSDYWKYDTLVNSWTAIANFPGPLREGAVGFCVGNNGYISSGGSPFWPYIHYTDLWKYNASFNNWTSLASYSATGRRYSAGFVIDSCLYIGTGNWSGFDPATLFADDLWKYCFSTSTSINETKKAQINIFPNPFSSQTTLTTADNFKNATLTIFSANSKPVNHET